MSGDEWAGAVPTAPSPRMSTPAKEKLSSSGAGTHGWPFGGNAVSDVRRPGRKNTPAARVDDLERGRQAFARREWRAAFEHMRAASSQAPLSAEDLERLATATSLVGRDDDSAEAWARAHQEFLNRGETEHAARCAFWVAFILLTSGKAARGGGWVSRGRRLLEDAPVTAAVRGLMLIPAGIQLVIEGDIQGAHDLFIQACEIGDACRDPDLMTLARHGRGRALIRLGKTAEGVMLLDESMVAVTADEVTPSLIGGVYCSVIAACREIFDLRRAREWTVALNDWCAAQPDAVQYRGYCLVHRAEMLQINGAWPDAMQEAERACEKLDEAPAHRAAGEALYQQGELHRLRGDFARAEDAYRQASQLGREPQPGLAQMRLAQGQIDLASAAIRNVLNETQRHILPRVLPAYIEIMIAARDLPAARAAAEDLAGFAARIDAPFLHAIAAHANGALLLAEQDDRRALTELRRAWSLYRAVDAPYEAARVRTLVAVACRSLGDEDGADMEIDAARQIFTQLGAAPELTQLERFARRPSSPAGGLSAREAEVLRLVATGKTNRAIADALHISEKTVARHVSNIFVKLNLSTRAAATAYAFENNLQ